MSEEKRNSYGHRINSWGDRVDTFGKCKNPIRRPSPNEFGGGSERAMIKTLVDQVNRLTGLLEKLKLTVAGFMLLCIFGYIILL